MNNDNRVLTLKERYLNFRKENDNEEIKEFLELIDHVEAKPTSVGIQNLERMRREVQPQIDNLGEEDRELIERIYHNVLFVANKAADNSLSKWEFFKQTVSENEWEPVQKIVDIIEENDKRYEEIRSGDKTVSDTVLREQYEQDKKDLELIEKLLKEEVVPWASENLSSFYTDLIKRTLNSRMRTIQNRLNRNTDLAFADWLKQTRKSKKLTLQELADRSNTSISYIQRLETGKRKVPSLPIVQNIAEGLGVPFQEVLAIISGEDEKEEQVAEVHPIQDVLLNTNYKIKDREATRQEKRLINELVVAALNENGKAEIDNLLDLPNIARKLQEAVMKVEQEDMSDTEK